MNEVEIATTCPTCGQPVTVTIDVDPWINTWANVVLTGAVELELLCEGKGCFTHWVVEHRVNG